MKLSERIEALKLVAANELSAADPITWAKTNGDIRRTAKALIGRDGKQAGEQLLKGRQINDLDRDERLAVIKAEENARRASRFDRWERLGTLLQKTFDDSARSEAAFGKLVREIETSATPGDDTHWGRQTFVDRGGLPEQEAR